MLTQAGSGYSTCDGLDVTRWREDATSDCWGQYFYIRDLDGGRAWSAGRQPLGGDADELRGDRSVRIGPSSSVAMGISKRAMRSRSPPTRMPRFGGSR